MSRRLVLTLHPGAVDTRSLERFVRLASELGVDLEALLIEDQDLLTVAGLPFCQEVIRSSARTRRIDTRQLESATRQLSTDLCQQLERLTRHCAVSWKLRIHRGQWFDGLGEDWAHTELLVLVGSRPSAAPPLPARGASAAVAVLCSGDTDSAPRALQLAARLARAQHQPLLVLASPESPYRALRDLPPAVAGYRHLRFEKLGDAASESMRQWLPCLADTLVLPQGLIWPDGRPGPHPLLDLPGIQTLVVR